MHKLNVILALGCLALSSCANGAFDDLEDSAWAHSAGNGAVEGGFGYAIIPAGSSRADLKYFVAADLDPVFLPVAFNQDGGRNTGDVAFIRSVGDDNSSLGDRAVFAADESSYTSMAGNVAIGYADAAGAAKLFMLIGEGPEGQGGVAGRFVLSAGSGAPSGVAFGKSNATATDVVDLFAVAGTQLNLLPDYQALDKGTPAGSCSLTGDQGGAVLLANVDGVEGDEVLAAIDGQVFATTGLTVKNAIDNTEGCFDTQSELGSIAAPGGEESFGLLMDQGNFDAGDLPDLVIAAPDEGAVYVVLNWDGVSASPTTIKIPRPGGSVGFGKSIAVGDFNDDGLDELVISAPQSDIAAHPEAGKVFIFGSDGSGVLAAAPLTLHDARAQDKQVFGKSLAVAQAFGEDILIVGANDEVFTYFRTPVTGDEDMRPKFK